MWHADRKELSYIRGRDAQGAFNMGARESQFLADPMRAFEHKMGNNFSSIYKSASRVAAGKPSVKHVIKKS